MKLVYISLFLLLACNLLWGPELMLAQNWDIFLNLRLPRLLAACLVGLALSSAGVVFQSILNNVLADSYVLGVSSGASAGALLAITFSSHILAQNMGGALGGIVALILLIVFQRTQRSRERISQGLTLWGICITLFFTSVTVFLLQFLDPATHYQASRWFMGSLGITEWKEIAVPAFIILFSYGFSLRTAKHLHSLSCGPTFSHNLNLNYEKSIYQHLVSSTFLTIGAVSLAGPIGFVGLMSPHIAKRIKPPVRNSFELFWRSSLMGIIILLLCEAISRILLWKYSIPTGTLTAFVGAPFMAFLLWSRRQ